MDPLQNSQTSPDAVFLKGTRVPKDAVGLAWTSSPQLTPGENVFVIDTSNTIPENARDSVYSKKVMFANYLGILEDEFGNQVVQDEYPIVGDVFSIEEDNLLDGTVEYTPESILGFVHVSRYFHLDYSGLVVGSVLNLYKSSVVSVVNSRGDDYVDDDGKKRYVVKIAAASQLQTEENSLSAYRIHVFVDTDTNEDLYVTYNKCEIDTVGRVHSQEVSYQEVLNPQPYYSYSPEESDVVDFVNKDFKIYSTKPASKKEQMIGTNKPDIEGYNIYVPSKAEPDPRIFQLFRWRLKAEFTNNYKLDPTREPKVVRCGVIVDSHERAEYQHSRTPYVFYNLQRSAYNAGGIKFINPLKTGDTADTTGQQMRSYWEVDMRNVTQEQLAKFDILLYSTNRTSININNKSWWGKLNTFMYINGGTVIIETDNNTHYDGFQHFDTTYKTDPASGFEYGGDGNRWASLKPETNTPRDWSISIDHEVYDQLANLGGWQFNDSIGDNEKRTISPYQSNSTFGGYKTQHISPVFTGGYESIMGGKNQAYATRPVIMSKDTGTSGKFYFSTCGAFSMVNILVDPSDKTLYSRNWNAQKVLDSTVRTDFPALLSGEQVTYETLISSQYVEGAYKLLYNICLLAVSGKTIDSSDESGFSSVWGVATDWKASWVIDADAAQLTQEEIEKNDLKKETFLDGATPGDPIWTRDLMPGYNAETVIKSLLNEKNLINKVNSSTIIRYFLEVSNTNVECEPELAYNAPLKVWTLADTPAFSVRGEMGPFVIREYEEIGDYSPGTFVHKEFLPKKFSAKVIAEYSLTKQVANIWNIDWTASYTAKKRIKHSKSGPGNVTKEITWSPDSDWGTYSSTRPHEYGLSVPNGLSTWQDENYYSTKWGLGLQNWPSWRMNSVLKIGSSGEHVMFLQDFFNAMRHPDFDYFSSDVGYLPVDGRYDTRLFQTVMDFQIQFGATCAQGTGDLDRLGVVDTETWFLIGNQVMRFGGFATSNPTTGYKRFYHEPFRYINKQNISDQQNSFSFFLKESNRENPPRRITDFIRFRIKDEDNPGITPLVHGISITPYLPGGTPSMYIDFIDLIDHPRTLAGYDPRYAKVKSRRKINRNQADFYIGFGPYRKDTVVVGLSQDRSSGRGGALELGISDLKVHIASDSGGGKISITGVNGTIAGTTTLRTPTSATAGARIPAISDATYSDIEWSDFAITGISGVGDGDYTVTYDGPSNSSGYIIVSGAYIRFTMNQQTGRIKFSSGVPENTGGSSDVTYSYNPGPAIPVTSPDGNSQLSYTMSVNGSRSSEPTTGYISVSDGLVLFCDSAKRPIGFPDMSDITGPDEEQIHYTTLSVYAEDADTSFIYGFYDKLKQEFIQTADGSAVMTILEYNKRGPQNVYVAALSKFVVEASENYPKVVEEETPKLPYKWAMPVYGVTLRGGSQIRVEKPTAKLGPTDMWSLPIKTGKFNRVVHIPAKGVSPISSADGEMDWVNQHQGKTVRAFYSIPEADRSNWSALFGRPFIDITAETPTIEDDSTISVSSPPILMARRPSTDDSDADPVIPIFSLYTRDSVYSDWEKWSWADIKDYNVSNGRIYLDNELSSTDPSLIKIDYTSASTRYMYHGNTTNKLFLNPYLPFAKDIIGKPIYICMYPEFAHHIDDILRPFNVHIDSNETMINESIRQETLFWTTDPTSFSDPLSPSYNPLIVQLAVVYVTNASDINDISLIDIRRRGGGLATELSLSDSESISVEFKNNWDINHPYGEPYQVSGFLVIRLPASLVNRFPDRASIDEVIERNIPAGVKYKLEDMDGNDWDSL